MYLSSALRATQVGNRSFLQFVGWIGQAVVRDQEGDAGAYTRVSLLAVGQGGWTEVHALGIRQTGQVGRLVPLPISQLPLDGLRTEGEGRGSPSPLSFCHLLQKSETLAVPTTPPPPSGHLLSVLSFPSLTRNSLKFRYLGLPSMVLAPQEEEQQAVNISRAGL